ncbi:ATP-binding protein [Halorubellus sp. JP-L1]|uniref:ATP-binding protein n=1 Tax=Halorubellus sp. JP-L1 TaxID=2715753 RepID=UPI00140CC114|nr:ATP-binding protein [Halorubellus sp. JP-L1]NHN41277.1 ATP-binding protein [Halorubellus sp. JP-L1]
MTDLGDFGEFTEDDDAGGDVASGEAASGRTGSSGSDGGGADVQDDDFERVDVSPAGEDDGVGTVAVSAGLQIAEREEDTQLRAYVTTGNRPRVRIGKYLLVPYPDGEKLFCRITGLEYEQAFVSDDANEIHSRRAMRRDGIDEADYKFMATLEPMSIIFEDGAASEMPREDGDADGSDGELKRRMVDRVPKPETVVREASDTEEIKTGLKMPDDGVFLGHLSVGGEKVRTAAEPPTIDYRLKDDYSDGDPLLFRHTLVAGGTGSGKTHGAKNVLRQFLAEDRTYPMADGRESRPAVVMFDPQDEYAQMHDDNPDVDDAFRRRLEREGVAHGGVEDCKAFVPKVGEATYAADHHRAEQVEFTIPFSMVRSRPWLVASAGLNDNQYPALKYLLKRFFDDHGHSGTYSQFRSFLDDPALKEELDEAGRVHEATFDAIKRRTYGFGDVFDQSARSITDVVHEFVRPGGMSVVPTYHVTDSRQTTTVVLALASLLVDQKLSNDPVHDRIKETPLVLGMDEAHNFLTDAEDVQARKVISKFTDAAKQGRKERLGLFLITQDPQDVADPVFKQVNSTVVLNLGDEDAISAVNIPANLEDKVPYMEKGQMVVYSPDNSEPVEIVGLSKCLTKHGR